MDKNINKDLTNWTEWSRYVIENIIQLSTKFEQLERDFCNSQIEMTEKYYHYISELDKEKNKLSILLVRASIVGFISGLFGVMFSGLLYFMYKFIF